jgi:hypothetical protein
MRVKYADQIIILLGQLTDVDISTANEIFVCECCSKTVYSIYVRLANGTEVPVAEYKFAEICPIEDPMYHLQHLDNFYNVLEIVVEVDELLVSVNESL